jgi:uncharacterized protein
MPAMNAAAEPSVAAIAEGAVPVLREALPGLLAVYLYGSFARGDAFPDSDIDLGYYLRDPRCAPDLREHLHIVSRLSEALRREAELVNLHRAGLALRRDVLAQGIVLFSADPEALLDLEARTLTEYGEHRERIRAILEDVAATGVAYRQ